MASTPSSQAPLSVRYAGTGDGDAGQDAESSAQARKHDERLRSFGPLTNVVFDDEGDETDEERSYISWSDLFTRRAPPSLSSECESS